MQNGLNTHKKLFLLLQILCVLHFRAQNWNKLFIFSPNICKFMCFHKPQVALQIKKHKWLMQLIQMYIIHRLRITLVINTSRVQRAHFFAILEFMGRWDSNDWQLFLDPVRSSWIMNSMRRWFDVTERWGLGEFLMKLFCSLEERFGPISGVLWECMS